MTSQEILKKYWGFDSFRPMQKEIIDSVLGGKDTLGILPTGGGKSVTFQVPGLQMEGLIVVVTPLISLMKDQVDNLHQRGIRAVALHSGMTFQERNLARERIFNDKVKFLYLSPERLSSDAFMQEIKRLKIGMIVVDEAHCISQWGYDFRPSYLKVKILRKLFPHPPVLALTASATKEVEQDVCRQLEFRKDYNLFRGSISRHNLSYVVRPSEGKLFDIHHILSSIKGSAIVYVRSRKRTREIAEYLENSGISASYYHAGIDALEKEKKQAQWKNGETRVMVATNAFGMGIDKPDVRVVIHYDMPPSLEEYYQEAGRAGRDGLQAYAVLLTAKADKAVLRRRLTAEFPEKDVIKRIYTRLCVFCHLEIGEGYDKTMEFDILKFCKTYMLDESLVRPALRILGQARYAEFIEEYENSSRLMVTIERDELYRTKLMSPENDSLLTTILRTYPGLFTDYVFISEKKLAYISGLDTQKIYAMLVALSKSKIIHYIPRRRTPLIYFPTSMEEERYVLIGRDVYEVRREILKKRIESMIDYGFSSGQCRLKKMMDYFGESGSDDCGHCDSCRERKKRKRKIEDENEISRRLHSLFSESSTGYSEKELKSFLGTAFEKAMEILRILQRDGITRFSEGKWMMTRYE